MPELDRPMLENVVRCAGHSPARITDWTVHPLSGGRETVSDIHRVNVRMQLSDGNANVLSLILKVVRATPERRSPDHWNYWRREVEAYQSGELAALPAGVATPQCYGVVDRDDEVWLWLECLPVEQNAPWSEVEISHAAFELGRFNGAYLTSAALPSGTWVSRGWLRHYVETYAPFIEQLPGLQSHPLIGQAVSPALLPNLLKLTAQRKQWLDWLDPLPRVFCHLDAWRNNMFLTSNSPHGKPLVIIDWAFAGVGALGQELAPLIFTNRRVPDIHKLTCQGYAAGLRDVGWQGDDALIVQSSAITAALVYGVAQVGFFISNLLDAREHAALEAGFGRPIDQIPPRATAWVEFGLHYADTADSPSI